MSYLSSSAVVLRSFRLGESDRLVTLLTRQAGMVKAVAKGAVKSRKRFGGVLLTGNHISARVFVKKKTTLHRLDAADLIESYQPLSGDPALFAAGSHLLELTGAFAVQEEGDPRQFALLTSTLRGLCNLGLEERLLRIFELRTLTYAGHAPYFETCVDCQKPIKENQTVCFSKREGGVRCMNCQDNPDAVRIPPGTRRLLSDIIQVESKLLPRLVFKPTDLTVAGRILPPFCEYVLSRKLRSWRILRRLSRP